MEQYFEKIKGHFWRGPRPDWVDTVVSMTHSEEKKMLFDTVLAYPDSINCIVDGGAFLGASTMAFSLAIEARESTKFKDAAQPIYSFDLFETERLGAALIRRKTGRVQEQGSDLLPFFLHTLGDKVKYCNVIKGDVRKFSIREKHVDILFLDCLKTKSINDFFVREYFPKVIPNKSLVIQQDYFHELTPWIAITMSFLSDWFERIALCQSSALFRLTKPFTVEDAAQAANRLNALTLEQEIDLLEQAKVGVDQKNLRALLDLAKLRACFFANAKHTFETESQKIASEYAELSWVQQKMTGFEKAIA